ncbi:MAG: tRNA pseudouridine(38-40) synthase TruA [Anaerolineales bacterium]|jgi:tRNA pseudouridine38-40 synthase|nr:tRNA pseudouridine(38-40) synthase TruA [Anaerolineales bacterium]
MARYQIILAYDGTDFCGSQRQAQARTVQGELENALRRIGWAGRSVLLAGRTDSGVHASGQVAAVDFDNWRHSQPELLDALNSQLPRDMAASALMLTSDAFHPRFDAVARCYVYRLFFQPTRNPLRERFAWRIWPPLEVEALREAASILLGTHDFSAFGTPPRPESTTVRTISQAEWQSHEDELRFTVQAEAFLYRMVRRMTFLQVAFAQRRLSAQTLAASLAASTSGERLPAGLAPAHGLALVSVRYSNRE